jgi:hypothetical protein
VAYSFFFLVIKRALAPVGEVAASQSVRCPAAVMSHEPTEEAAIVGHPSFPYALPCLEVGGSLEHSVVS